MKQKKVPQRLCVGCQEMKDKKMLLRIVRTPEDEIIIDDTGKKSGRGAYVCCKEECFRRAYTEKRLEKSLHHIISADIYEQLREEVRKHEQ